MQTQKSYSTDYIQEAHAQVQAQMQHYKQFLNTLPEELKHTPTHQKFEHDFLNHMVVALDHYFDFRSHDPHEKKGNVLNEVHLLSHSVKHHHGIFNDENDSHYNADDSLLKFQYGQPITLSVKDFILLTDAYFAQINGVFL